MSSTAGEANKLSSYRKNKLANNADKNAEGNPTSHATAVVARTTDRPLLTGRRNAPPGARHPAHVRAPTTSKGCVGRAASPLPPLPTLSRREMPPPCGSTRLDRKLEGSRTTPSTCFHSTSRVVNGSRRAPTTKTSQLHKACHQVAESPWRKGSQDMQPELYSGHRCHGYMWRQAPSQGSGPQGD